MKKTVLFSITAVVVAIVALGLATTAYFRTFKKGIEITTERPKGVEEKPEGPIYAGEGNGFIIKFENGTVLYLSGDTALFSDMKWVIHDYYRPDIALLASGNVFTMDPIDAAFATTWIDPKYVAPYHYRIFPFLEQTSDRFVELVSRYRNQGKTRAQAVPIKEGEEWEAEGVKITWLGHGSFLFVSPTGIKILVDPWLTPNPGTPAEFKDMSVFGKVDLLLLTHGHLDHFDLEDMGKIVELYNPAILSQWEIMGYLQPKIPGQYLMMNKGGRITKEVLAKQEIETNIPEALEVTMVHADHSSSAP